MRGPLDCMDNELDHSTAFTPSRKESIAVLDGTAGLQRFAAVEEMLSYVQSSPTTSMWIDLQGESTEHRRELLDRLPWDVAIPSVVKDAVARPTESDVVELQPTTANYAHGVITAAIDPGHAGSTAAPPDNGGFSGEAFDAARGFAWCTVLATRRFIVTMHDNPFVGSEEVARALEMHVAMASEAGDLKAALSTSLTLATLVSYTSEMMLPDPTALLSEVDCIDEMVLLIAPGERDQPDLLRRVALLRRRISSFRGTLYLKEKLLRELVTPAMRGSFVSCDTQHVMPIYKEALDKNTQVADRLDDARDILNQANLNFVTGVSMRMSQSSANMDFKMQILGQVATVCLPLNLIASIFGMNCEVPWQSDTHDNLHAFWGIIGVMAAWCLICSIPTIREVVRGHHAKPIVPTDS